MADLICPYNNNPQQQDIETAVTSFSWAKQEETNLQQQLTDSLNKLDNIWHGGGSDKNKPQNKDIVDWAFMQCCQVIFPLVLDVSTAQQNIYADSEDVSSSVGALVSQVQDLQAKGANYVPTDPKTTPDYKYNGTGMSTDDANQFYQASADLQWDLNCTSYSYSDGTHVDGNYLQGAIDDGSRTQISDANVSIMATFGITPTIFNNDVKNGTDTDFTKLSDTNGTISTDSNKMWTNTASTTGDNQPTAGQAMDPKQTNMNDRFSTESTICNSTEQTFNMRLQYAITDTNTDMSTESEIEKTIIDSNEQRIKAQKGS